MQHSPLFHSIRALACAVLLASVAQAAELGDISVRSFIGQPLAADIELVSLAPDEINALQVRLAQADVFRGANIAMNPALASVRMSVVKRDQKQFLHVTTTRAIDTDYVHLYVEMSAAGRQDVRLATVWLQADPNPAPPPVQAPLATALTATEAGQIAAQAKAERAAKAADAALVAASAATSTPVRDRARPAPMPSSHESEVGVPAVTRALVAPLRRTPLSSTVRDLPERIAGAIGSPRPVPNKRPASKEEAQGDAAVPVKVAQALLPLPSLPLPKGIKRQEAPAACTPSGASAKECAALDNHSAALSSKLVELEGKVKVLQGALGGAGAAIAAPGHAAAPAASPAVPGATVQTHAAVAKTPAASVAHDTAAPSSASASAHAASAPVTKMAPAPVSAATAAAAAASASAEKTSAPAAASHAASAASAAVPRATQASASASGSVQSSALAAQVEAPTAAAASASASASSASAEASAAASVPVKKVRVLPKLKYKKEKPVERPTNYPALAAGGLAVLLLAGAGFIYLRKRKAGGAGPLKIWQGFRRKNPVEPVVAPHEAPSLHEATPESVA